MLLKINVSKIFVSPSPNLSSLERFLSMKQPECICVLTHEGENYCSSKQSNQVNYQLANYWNVLEWSLKKKNLFQNSRLDEEYFFGSLM